MSRCLMSCARDNLRGQKSLGPLKMSLEMAHKVIVPQKKNYVPKFLKGVLRRENQGLKVYSIDGSSVFSMTGTYF